MVSSSRLQGGKLEETGTPQGAGNRVSEHSTRETDAVASQKVGPSSSMAFSVLQRRRGKFIPMPSVPQKGVVSDAPLRKRFRLFGSWVEPPGEAEGGGGQSLGVQERGVSIGEERRAGGLEEQLLQLDGDSDRQVGGLQAASCEKDGEDGVRAVPKPLLGLFEDNAAVRETEVTAFNATCNARGSECCRSMGLSYGERSAVVGRQAASGADLPGAAEVLERWSKNI